MDELSKEEMTKICVQTLTDDTHWDLMTGSLLKKRLKAYFEDLDNQQKLVSAMNCLRLTELVYLIKQEGDAITMPIVPVPEGTTMMLFTSKKEIKQTNLKAFEPRESLLPEILDCFDSDEVKGWLLLRMSLHDPQMPLNIEGAREGDCDKLFDIVLELLKGFDKLMVPDR